jgi:hypothetical protein
MPALNQTLVMCNGDRNGETENYCFAGADTQRAAQRVTRRKIDASFNVENEIDADGNGEGSGGESEDKKDRDEKDDEFVFDSA